AHGRLVLGDHDARAERVVHAGRADVHEARAREGGEDVAGAGEVGGEERGGRAPVGDAARAVHDRVGGGRVREGAARDVPGTVARAAQVGRVRGGAAAVGEHRRAAGGERPAHRAAD